MILFGGSGSGHSYKVRLHLLLGQIPHAYEWIDLGLPRERRPQAFQQASLFGEVPVLVDEGRAFCQSNAILMHLAQRQPHMLGERPAAALEWLCWEANRIGFSVPNLRHATLQAAQPPEVMGYLRGRVLADLACLDKHLAAQQFLVGGSITVADISCCAYLFWLHDIGIERPAYPHVHRWLNEISALPHWVHPDQALMQVTRT